MPKSLKKPMVQPKSIMAVSAEVTDSVMVIPPSIGSAIRPTTVAHLRRTEARILPIITIGPVAHSAVPGGFITPEQDPQMAVGPPSKEAQLSAKMVGIIMQHSARA
ncbi:hypothetical protein IKZ77_02720 [Candidatus Saccharibacteria bacterium]|nr:hypothetical protein [Candidatus Saccharibacteria bacterium]